MQLYNLLGHMHTYEVPILYKSSPIEPVFGPCSGNMNNFKRMEETIRKTISKIVCYVIIEKV